MAKPWEQQMSDKDFDLLTKILEAPSPSGMEAAMTYGVVKPIFDELAKKHNWLVHTYIGNAGIVLDTKPQEFPLTTLMIVGHADKIRLQVRSVGSDGKVWLSRESFLPATLLSNKVKVFSKDPNNPEQYKVIRGTVEAIGAIHFASNDIITGSKGIAADDLYLELGVYGPNKKEQVEALGIRPGDPILFDRPIEKGIFPHTFRGPYLDNGLGCFTVVKLAQMFAKNGMPKNIRLQFALASQEELGRCGSRVLVQDLMPELLVAVDVNHDFKNAPKVGGKNYPQIEMGNGFTIATGSITSPKLNDIIEMAAKSNGTPYQIDVDGRDSGTDAMAGVLASQDVATASLGFPIRNMHTASELGHTGDIIGCIHALYHAIHVLDRKEEPDQKEETIHPNLSKAT